MTVNINLKLNTEKYLQYQHLAFNTCISYSCYQAYSVAHLIENYDNEDWLYEAEGRRPKDTAPQFVSKDRIGYIYKRIKELECNPYLDVGFIDRLYYEIIYKSHEIEITCPMRVERLFLYAIRKKHPIIALQLLHYAAPAISPSIKNKLAFSSPIILRAWQLHDFLCGQTAMESPVLRLEELLTISTFLETIKKEPLNTIFTIDETQLSHTIQVAITDSEILAFIHADMNRSLLHASGYTKTATIAVGCNLLDPTTDAFIAAHLFNRTEQLSPEPFLKEFNCAKRLWEKYPTHFIRPYAYSAMSIMENNIRKYSIDMLFDQGIPLRMFIKSSLYSEIVSYRFARDLIDTVFLLHQTGMLHGDIKVENVIAMNNDGKWNAKLIDFGLSYSLRKNRESQMMQLVQYDGDDERPINSKKLYGAIEYRAPELASYDTIPNNEAHFQVEMYALGITVAELLGKKLPWAKLSPEELQNEPKIKEEIANFCNLPSLVLDKINDDTIDSYMSTCSLVNRYHYLLMNMTHPLPDIRWSAAKSQKFFCNFLLSIF